MLLREIASEIAFILSDSENADGELSDDTLLRLNALEMAFGEKADAICTARAELLGEADTLDDEIRRLTAKRDARRKRADWLKAYLHGCMVETGQTNVSGALYSVRVQKNSQPSVTVDVPVEKLPGWCQNIKVNVTANHTAIVEAWKAGGPVPQGVRIETGTHLRIK